MIGNVEPGSGKSWETDVTPMVEGYGSGILHITYEDSNGNVSEFDESFSSEIQSASMDIDNGGMWDDGGMTDVDGTGVVETKKEILPIWAYIPALVVLFLAALFVTKSVIIKRYKKKELKRLEEDDLD